MVTLSCLHLPVRKLHCFRNLEIDFGHFSLPASQTQSSSIGSQLESFEQNDFDESISTPTSTATTSQNVAEEKTNASQDEHSSNAKEEDEELQEFNLKVVKRNHTSKLFQSLSAEGKTPPYMKSIGKIVSNMWAIEDVLAFTPLNHGFLFMLHRLCRRVQSH